MADIATVFTRDTVFARALCISAAAVLVLGIAPRSILAFAERSILSLLM